ncbi:hypothetical protein BSL78_05666 [Apostichopus japonicus]|uniref:SRCR domain-containing protein n=1 Tax=Stichopus japonicus TaxID=307972 RepID=A0A2G8LB55_STIJA|nr:hypothetical protein BSL78_05666 [Apostichopus japonicus]
MKYFLAGSCDGTESSLGECSLNFLEANHDCGVLQVQCLPANASGKSQSSRMGHFLKKIQSAVELQPRFLKCQNSMEGIPLVYLDRQWSPICHGVLNDAVCNQLGLGDEGGWKEVPSWVEVFDNTHREIGFSCSSTTESHLRECQLTAISCCECTGYLSISCLGDYDDSGNGSRRRNSGGYSYFYGFVGVIVVVIIIARRFYIAKTRQTNGRLCTLSGNARTSRVRRPRDATSSSNNGPSIPAAQYTNTQPSFGAEYNTPASFSAFPPPYSGVSSPAYPPVSEPGAQTSALAYPPVSEPGAPTSALAYPPVSQPGAQTSAHDQQVTAPAVDPNLPTYEQASKADGPR